MRIVRACVALLASCTPAATSSSGAPRVLGPPSLDSSLSPLGVQGEPFSVGFTGVNLGDSLHPGAITLSRTRDVTGQPLGGVPVSIPAKLSTGGGPDTASATFPGDALLPGVYSAVVRNAQGVDASLDEAVLVLPRPAITSVDRRFYCFGAPSAVKLSGSFFNFDGEPLQLEIQIGTYVPQRMQVQASGCAPVPYSRVAVNLCSAVSATGLPAGESQVTVVVPRLRDALARQGSFDLTRDLFGETPGAPTGSRGLYSANAAPVPVLVWDGWAVTGPGVAPTALMEGTPVALTGKQCSPSKDGTFQICQWLEALIPQGAAPGVHTLAVTGASGCTRSASLELAPVPVIEQVATICAYARRPVEVIGSGLVLPEALVDGQRADATPCRQSPPGKLCLDLMTASGFIPPGNHTLQLVNASTPPVSSASVTVQSFPGPPSVAAMGPLASIYAGATRQVFVPASALDGNLVSAVLVGSTGRTAVQAVQVSGGLEITYPALGVTDLYFLEVTDQSPCVGRSGYPLETRADPVIFSSDFETGTQAVSTGMSGPALTSVSDGNPGKAAQASSAGVAGDWYLHFSHTAPSVADVGLLRFDLRARGSGAPSTAPGFRLTFFDNHQLEHALSPPPSAAWTHYELRFDSADGWSYRDAGGSIRPATLAEVRADGGSSQVLGSWWPGTGDTAIDNLAEEYER